MTELSASSVASGVTWAKVQSSEAIAPPIAKELASPNFQQQLLQLWVIWEFASAQKQLFSEILRINILDWKNKQELTYLITIIEDCR